MSIDAGTIYSSIRIKLDQLENDIRAVQGKLDKFAQSSGQAAGTAENKWTSSFKQINLAGIAAFTGIALAAKAAASTFAKFDQSMANVASVARATPEDFAKLTKAAEEAGETTRFSASQAADALYYMASAGYNAEQSIAALDGVLKLAGATQSDLAFTSETVAATINQFGLAASDATRISNVFAAAIVASQATMDKLATSMAYVGPVASAMGMSLEQTVGALQVLYNSGLDASMAGTALRGALADLANAASPAQKRLRELGISYNEINPMTNSFADIIDLLNQRALTGADALKIFGDRAGPAMIQLMKAGKSEIERYTQAVTGTNAAAEAYARQNDTLLGSVDELSSAFESLQIKFVREVAPAMRGIVDILTRIVSAIGNAPAPVKVFIAALAAGIPITLGLAAAIGAIGAIVGTIAGPILLVVAGVAALTAGISFLAGQSEKGTTSLDKVVKSLSAISEEIDRAKNIGAAAKRIDQLLDRYDELKKQANLTKKEQDELNQIIKDISDLAPQAVTAWDDTGKAIEISGAKARSTAGDMRDLQKAVLEEQLSKLKLQEALFKETVRRDRAEVERINKERGRLAQEGLIAQQRIALITKFQSELQRSTAKGGATVEQRFVSILSKMSSEFKKVGINTDVYFASSLDAIKYFAGYADQAEKKLAELKTATEKETKIEIDYKKAVDALNQIDELQKKIIGLQTGEPVETPILKTGTTENKPEKDFWGDFSKSMQKASIEAAAFGDESDILKAKIDLVKKTYKGLLDEGLSPGDEQMRQLMVLYDALSGQLDVYNAKLETQKSAEEKLAEAKKKRAEADRDAAKTQADYVQKLADLNSKTDDAIYKEWSHALAVIEASGASRDAINQTKDAINDYFKALTEKKATEDFKKNIETLKEVAWKFATDLLGGLGSLFGALTDARIDELDRQLQAELKAKGLAETSAVEAAQAELNAAIASGNAQTIEAKRNALEKAKIEEEYEKKKAQIQYKGQLAQWTTTLLQAIAEGARAIIVSATSLPWPLNLVPIAATTAITGLQIGTITASKPKPPHFETGGVMLGDGNPAGKLAMLHPPETILNGEQMARVFNMITQGGAGGTSIPVVIPISISGREVARTTVELINSGGSDFKVSTKKGTR